MSSEHLGILAVFIFAAAVMILILKENRNQRKQRLERINNMWGNTPKREYSMEELAALADYVRRKNGENLAVDDITWNDLNMNRVYERMNHCMSACGDEYLYEALRMPAVDETVLDERERLFSFFDSHPKERVCIQEILDEIGRIRDTSITDCVRTIREAPTKNAKKYVFFSISALCNIVFLFLWPVLGLLLFLGFLVINVVIHSKESDEMDVYLKSLSRILKVIRTAQKLGKMKIPELSDYLNRLREESCKLKGISKKCLTLIHARSMDGDITNMISSYFNAFFLLDFISFSSVICEVKQNYGRIEQIIRDLGLLDYAVSVASYRKELPYYCKPVFLSPKCQNSSTMNVQDLYHPLLQDPVANTVYATGGILITGSNASGKSTFLKSIGVNAILSQAIHTSMSHSYQGAMYHVMTSMALRDNIENGESYYIVEIRSLKRILDQSKRKEPLLCIVDEVFRGTNTIERIAASSQVLSFLCKPQILCMAATHDIELTYILEDLYHNYHFEERIADQNVKFDYLLKEGRAKSRNAIALLTVMGYDSEIVEGAKKTVDRFEKEGIWKRN
ncbi:MAG: DNA mismatch repair protein MutS [Fusicatenibacter sp.]|nr:DNA mismatch repair protein MutS [Lachnospiraceae bacterium]MDY2937490.1 DNA mismatch repair protein MutS [Fusicatenibacter sp.]